MRPTFLDPVLMGLFGAMAFFAIATDLLQALGSTGNMSRDDWSMLPVPGRWLDAIDWWFAHDLLLKANPLWYRLMAVVSPIVYLPFVRFPPDLHFRCLSRSTSLPSTPSTIRGSGSVSPPSAGLLPWCVAAPHATESTDE